MGSHFKTRSKLARATAGIFKMEGLENRQLLTTLNGGDVFFYKDKNDEPFRITVLGNTQAEFVGATVDDTNNVTLGDLVSAFAPDDVDGAELFSIYVAQSDWDSVITIEHVIITPGQPIVLDPFSGTINLNVTNARNGQNLALTTNGDSGQAYLGARTNTINGLGVGIGRGVG